MFGLKQKTLEPVKVVVKPIASRVETIKESALQEYENIAIQAGYTSHDFTIQKFRTFLDTNNIPTFNLQEVIKYMDHKAVTEGKDRWGWKTLLENQYKAIGNRKGSWSDENCYFGSGRSNSYKYDNGRYKKAVPRHALEKVIAIRRVFGDEIMFLVSDYDLKPDFIERGPDPFLMAIIPNPEIKRGVGQFVVDFWDEPGFGLEQQLA